MSEVKVTKKELQDAVRNAVIGTFDLSGATKVDTGTFIVESGGEAVEIKFTVKSDKFNLVEAVEAYEEKLMKAEERKAKAAEKAAKDAEKTAKETKEADAE